MNEHWEIVGGQAAILYNKQWLGMMSPWDHFRVQAAK